MKILYAANNRYGSGIQLKRFLNSIKNKNITIKIAGFKKSLLNINADWNIGALDNFFYSTKSAINKTNYNIYYEQVKYFNPDLIISDLEINTSQIGFELNKPVWQVSPNLLYYGTPFILRKSSSIFNRYSYFFRKDFPAQKLTRQIISKSNKNLIYSHFGDLKMDILDNFQWVRPNYISFDFKSKIYEHNMLAALTYNDKKIIEFLKNYEDSVIFSNFEDEIYDNIIIKNINNIQEYSCNITNCFFFLCQGYEDYLADAFYNKKYAFIIPDFNDVECVVNACFSDNYNIGKILFDKKPTDLNIKMPDFEKNNNIKSLIEIIENEYDI